MNTWLGTIREYLSGGHRLIVLAALLFLYAVSGQIAGPSILRTVAVFVFLIVSRFLAANHLVRLSQNASERFRRAWQLYAAAMILWLISDLILAVTWFAELTVVSAPSAWHWIRVAGYLAFLLGAAVFPIVPSERFSRLRSVFDTLTLFLTTGGLFWSILLRPVLRTGLFPTIPFLWESSIIFFDVVLVFLLLRMFILSGVPEYPPSAYLFAAIAFSVSMIGDIQAGLENMEGSRVAGFSELLWMSGNLILIEGVRVRKRVHDGTSWFRSLRSRRRVEFWLPIILTYLLTGYVLAFWYLRGEPDLIGLGITAAAVTALISRQGVIAGQYELRQYETLVNTVENPAFICHRDGRLRLMNRSLRAIVEKSDLPNPAQYLYEIFTFAEGYPEFFQQGDANGWTGIVRVPVTDSTLTMSLQPIPDENKDGKYLAGSAYDLTELLDREQELHDALRSVEAIRRELEQLNLELEEKVENRTRELEQSVHRLGELNKELQELDRLKNEFVALVSHELRAPLTNVQTGVELALREIQSSSSVPEETLSLVQQEAGRLGVFVETILQISSIEAGRIRFKSEPADLEDILSEVLDLFQSTNLHSRTGTAFAEKLPLAMVDKRAIHSVIYHILDNVVKYAPEGAVTLSMKEKSSGILVSICDQGPGIPEEERERVFELFHRLDSRDAREVYGHGLGLAVAKRFLEAMDGWIRISNNESEGVGTCVRFWVPTVE